MKDLFAYGNSIVRIQTERRVCCKCFTVVSDVVSLKRVDDLGDLKGLETLTIIPLYDEDDLCSYTNHDFDEHTFIVEEEIDGPFGKMYRGTEVLVLSGKPVKRTIKTSTMSDVDVPIAFKDSRHLIALTMDMSGTLGSRRMLKYFSDGQTIIRGFDEIQPVVCSHCQ